MVTQKELNLRQRRWLELLKYYDMSVLYYPGKANVIVYALSRMTRVVYPILTKPRRTLQGKYIGWLGRGEVQSFFE